MSSRSAPASGRRPAFRPGGSVTGGNSSPLGAASMCIGVGQGIATLWEAC